MAKLRIRNTNRQGWNVLFDKKIHEENKELFERLGESEKHYIVGYGSPISFRQQLVMLDVIGVCDINYSLNKIQKNMDKYEFIPDPPKEEEKQSKKGFWGNIFG